MIDTSIYSQVRPPQAQDPLEQVGRLLALKNALTQQQQQARLAPIQERAAQQQIEEQDLAIEQKRLAMDQSRIVREAQARVNGDRDALVRELAGKVDPGIIAGIEKENIALKKSLGELDEQSRKKAEFTLGHVGGAAKLVLAASPDRKAAVWQGERAKLAPLGIELPEALPDDDSLQSEVLHAMGLEKWLQEGRAAAGEQRAVQTHGVQMAKAQDEQAARAREDLARQNPDDPTAQAAAMTADQRTQAQIQRERMNKDREPVPGRDIPLPPEVEAQRTRMNAVRAQLNGLSPQQFQAANSLGKQFDSHPVVKKYNTQVNQMESLEKILSGVSGTRDLAAVFDFMKGLDPDSVVRETEYANAAKSGNIFAGWAAKFNGYLKPEGGFLPPQVKSEFQNIVREKLESTKRQVKAIHGDYSRRIDNITKQSGTGKDYLTDYSTLYDQPEASASVSAPGLPKVGETFNGGKVKSVTRIQ